MCTAENKTGEGIWLSIVSMITADAKCYMNRPIKRRVVIEETFSKRKELLRGEL